MKKILNEYFYYLIIHLLNYFNRKQRIYFQFILEFIEFFLSYIVDSKNIDFNESHTKHNNLFEMLIKIINKSLK